MSQQDLWIILCVMAVVLAAATWAVRATQRSNRLRRRFGPEYDRAVEHEGGRHHAEKVLEMRAKRVEHLHIHALTEAERARFKDAWRGDQARFVDDPSSAVVEADRLVGEVMAARGYPIDDFEQRTADISVDYPQVVENYRAAHRIAVRRERGDVDTEDLRRAMRHYRALFEALLETDIAARELPRRAAAGG